MMNNLRVRALWGRMTRPGLIELKCRFLDVSFMGRSKIVFSEGFCFTVLRDWIMA